MDDRTTGESPHELLLALAGRIDDDLLAWCRELVAVGEDARALELLTATLIADRTPLPGSDRAALVRAARTARTDLGADTALAPAADDDTAHRFDAALPGVDHLAAALDALPARQVAGLRTWATMRVTPAGTAPGPLPHPVVLVEVGADDQRPVDVLAYQLAIACARAGAPAAVEVVVADAPRPRYQQAALRSARAVHGRGGPVADRPAEQVRVVSVPHELLSPGSPQPSLAAVPEPDTETFVVQALPIEQAPAADLRPVKDTDGDVVPVRPRPAPRRSDAQPDDEAVAAFRAASGLPGPSDEPFAERRETERRETESRASESRAPGSRAPGSRALSPVTPLRGAGRPAPRPSPAAAVTPFPRSAPHPMPSPVPVDRRGLTPVDDAPPSGPRSSGPPSAQAQPPDSQGPALASLDDPLNGPVDDRRAELDEPTIDENDPLGLGMLPVAPPEPDDLRPMPAPVSDSWLADWVAADWVTGDWAMSPSALTDPLDSGPRHSEPVPDESVRDGSVGEESVPEESVPEEFVPEEFVPEESGEEARAALDPVPPPAPEPTPSVEVEDGPAEPRSGRRRASASRQAFPVPEEGRLETTTPEPVVEQPVPEAALEQTGFILRPESVARLSDADRELLARLQAELDEVPRPRVTRRAGIGGTGSNGSGTNGHRPTPSDSP